MSDAEKDKGSFRADRIFWSPTHRMKATGQKFRFESEGMVDWRLEPCVIYSDEQERSWASTRFEFYDLFEEIITGD
jgi:hypothetical protein